MKVTVVPIETQGGVGGGETEVMPTRAKVQLYESVQARDVPMKRRRLVSLRNGVDADRQLGPSLPVPPKALVPSTTFHSVQPERKHTDVRPYIAA